MGLLSVGRLLPACGRVVDRPPRVDPDSAAATRATAPLAPALSGREPLRYAHGASGPADPSVEVVTTQPGREAAGRYDERPSTPDTAPGNDRSAAGADAPLPPADTTLPRPRPPTILLQAEDENGIELPAGFTSRVVARSGERPVAGSDYLWHDAPDGGATFGLSDGGHVYVSNSEIAGTGGVGALRFDAAGTLVDAYPVLEGSSRNCAGGATPWGTWISCEEVANGLCWECDPLGRWPAVTRPALGVFNHEAVAVDVLNHHVYLTEDRLDGRLYRFTASALMEDGSLDLRSGLLEVMEVVEDVEGSVRWHEVPDPAASVMDTRLQVPASTPFRGGEGIWFHQGVVFFATKLDNRVWALDVEQQRLSLIYDVRWYPSPTLTGIDNLAMSPSGHLLVAEDEGNMELALLDADGDPHVLLRVRGQGGSELAGPAFDLTGTRLYVSSQRGQGSGNRGITYEIRGPFDQLEI